MHSIQNSTFKFWQISKSPNEDILETKPVYWVIAFQVFSAKQIGNKVIMCWTIMKWNIRTLYRHMSSWYWSKTIIDRTSTIINIYAQFFHGVCLRYFGIHHDFITTQYVIFSCHHFQNRQVVDFVITFVIYLNFFEENQGWKKRPKFCPKIEMMYIYKD